jgi:hypothetical protein
VCLKAASGHSFVDSPGAITGPLNGQLCLHRRVLPLLLWVVALPGSGGVCAASACAWYTLSAVTPNANMRF